MAVSLIAKPYTLTPAYNEVKFIHDSTNKNLQGFKYIYDIYESGTTNKIAEYRVLPVYSTGYGEVDLSKLLQSYVSYDLNLTNTTVYNATNSHYKYDVKVGEEYLTTTTYTAALTQYLVAPYVGRVQINVANTFAVGDQINITQIGVGVTNPSMEGLFTVVVANPAFIVVNVLWSTIVNANKDGAITYADGRRTVTRDLHLDLNQYVFNGAIRWVDMPAYNWQDFMLNNVTDKLLTNQPNSFSFFSKEHYKATLSQDIWFNAVANGSPGGTDFMYFEADTGFVFRKAVNATDHVSGISVGPNNHGTLTPVIGSLPLITPTTTYYSVYYQRAGVQVSQRYYIGIDRRVRDIEYVILFLDRMGSWSSFAFTGRSYEKGNITRTQYNKNVEGYIATGPRWTYNTQDRGFLNTHITTDTTIDLNTNWMTEQMAEYFVELLSSPETYIKVADYSNACDAPISTDYVSCNIVTSSYEVYQQRNKNLIKQSITVKLANNNIVNG
jgi:hypothetical protein